MSRERGHQRSRGEVELLDLDVARRLVQIVEGGLSPEYTHRRPLSGPGIDVVAATQAAFDPPHWRAARTNGLRRPPTVARWVAAQSSELGRLVWSSPRARGEGLRRLAVAQLGTSALRSGSDLQFLRQAARLLITWGVPLVLRTAAQRIEREPSWWKWRWHRRAEQLRTELLVDAVRSETFTGATQEWRCPQWADLNNDAALRYAEVALKAILGVTRFLNCDLPKRPDLVVKGIAYAAESIVLMGEEESAGRDRIRQDFADRLARLLGEMGSPGAGLLAALEPGAPGRGSGVGSAERESGLAAPHPGAVVPIWTAGGGLARGLA